MAYLLSLRIGDAKDILKFGMMLRHNLLLIFRNFKRFKSTFFINLIGLSTGLACTLLIYMWVNDELHIDKFHEMESQLYQVIANYHNEDGIQTFPDTPGLLSKALLEEIPGIEYSLSTTSGEVHTFNLSHEDIHVKGIGLFASKAYFNVFSCPLIEGDKNQALSGKNSMVISESLALKLFSSEKNITGKRIEWDIMGIKSQVLISGIFKDLPAASSVQFDFLLPFDYYQDEIETYPYWNNNYAFTYLVLKEGTNIPQFNKKIDGFIKTKQKDSNITLFLQPFSERYLNGHYENGVPAGGRIEYVRLFSLIAVFILVIACINFMNLSTAKASRRIKEICIKKAIGAGRKTLFLQYMGESMLMSLLSLILSVIIVELLLPQFNLLTGKNLAMHFSLDLLLSVLGIMVFTGLIAGSYPALYLSGFDPVKVLKGKIYSSAGELWARKGLVVFQFVLSVMLIVVVMVVYKQIEFVQTKNLGYNRDNIIYFEKEGRVAEQGGTFITEIKKIPGVMEAVPTSYQVGGGAWTYGIQWEGMKPDSYIQFQEVHVGYDAIEMLGIQMASGRTFSKDFPSDSTGIIFNQAAIDAMGLADPLGKTVKHYKGEKHIVGITKNFQFESLYNNVKPLCVVFDPVGTNFIMIKIKTGAEMETLASLQKFYQDFNPGFSFDYKFMDQDYQALYSAEKRVAVLSRYFAGLAIIISCLGLFGLAAFTAERRIKEIGIRKIMGSSVFGIVRLLSSDFTKMVMVAIAIALPVSYLITKNWLEGFAYKIDLEWWYFIFAGLLALMIAWLTVALQTFKAARINPTQCLKEE